MTEVDKQTILFTCCTGSRGGVGRCAMNSALDLSVNNPGSLAVRIGTRNPGRAKESLANLFTSDRDIQIVELDLANPATFDGALRGIAAVFLEQPDIGGMNTTSLLEAFVESAQRTLPDPPFIVRLVTGVTCPEIRKAYMEVNSKLCDSHWKAYEVFGDARRQGTVDVTFVDACPWYFQDFTSMYVSLVRAGFLSIPNGNANLPYLDMRDLGEFVACILLNPAKYKNRNVSLTGAFKVTTQQWAKYISDVLPFKVKDAVDPTLVREEFGRIPIDPKRTLWTLMEQRYRMEQLVHQYDPPIYPNELESVIGREPRTPQEFCFEMNLKRVWYD